MRRARAKSVRAAFSAATALVVTGAFLTIFLVFADSGKILGALGAAPPLSWAGCLAAMSLGAALRLARLKTVYAQASTAALFSASTLHGAAVALLPGRLGEAVLPLALKRLTGVSLLSGAGFLLLVRLLDASTLAAFGGIAIAVAAPAFLPQISAGTVIAGLAFAAAVLAGLAVALRRGVPTIIGGGRHLRILRELADAAARLKPARLMAILVETIGIWAALAAAACMATDAVGLGAAPGLTIAATVAGAFVFASPINGVASVGPFEAAFAGALAAFGYAFEPALAAAAMVHISAVIVAIAAAGAGQALYALNAGRSIESEPLQCPMN